MADMDPKVLSAVEEALKKDPKASVDDLFEMAKGISPNVADLTKRQFHARYPLQVKRKLSPPKPRKPKLPKAAARRRRTASMEAPARDAIRATLLRFASDLTAAEARKDLVRVIAGVDRYVDEVLKAAGQK